MVDGYYLHGSKSTPELIFISKFSKCFLFPCQLLRGKSAHCNDSIRVNLLHLFDKIFLTFLSFFFSGISVVWWSTFNCICDEAALEDISFLEHISQQLPRPANKRSSCFIFFLPRCFSDNHLSGRVFVSLTPYDVFSVSIELAILAVLFHGKFFGVRSSGEPEKA